jgi:hypothetical protein
MTTSRIPAAIDYLVTLFRGAVTLGGPVVNGQQTGPVTVHDGADVTAEAGALALWVGVDDIDPAAGAPEAASATQSWAGLGRMARNEELAIYCVAQAIGGGDDVRSLRLSCAGIVAAVEDLVRADASLGGVVSTPGNAGVTATRWRQGPQLTGDAGMAVRVTVEITAAARIGG